MSIIVKILIECNPYRMNFVSHKNSSINFIFFYLSGIFAPRISLSFSLSLSLSLSARKNYLIVTTWIGKAATLKVKQLMLSPKKSNIGVKLIEHNILQIFCFNLGVEYVLLNKVANFYLNPSQGSSIGNISAWRAGQPQFKCKIWLCSNYLDRTYFHLQS